MMYENLGFPKFLAELIAAIAMDILDKFVAVMAMFFILKSMPNRFLTKLNQGEIFIKQDA
jgi:energy-coupling factor transport system substrate-specific component